MGNWQPTAENYQALIEREGRNEYQSAYPFCLAYPLETKFKRWEQPRSGKPNGSGMEFEHR